MAQRWLILRLARSLEKTARPNQLAILRMLFRRALAMGRPLSLVDLIAPLQMVLMLRWISCC